MNNKDSKQSVSGLLAVIFTFCLWGNLPLYWSLLFHIPNVAIVAYRVVFSWLFIVLLVSIRRQWPLIVAILHDKKRLLRFVLTALLINANWTLYVVGIATGHVMEASMGYYMNPLMNALCGAVFFKEGMRPLQKIALISTVIGVGYMIVGYGSIPFFAISLSLTFVAYGALHKLTKSGTTETMFFEMSYFLLPALGYLIWGIYTGQHSFFDQSISMMAIIACAGPLTMLPLMGFSYGVKRLRLTTVGIVQYLSPTATFILGILYFKEPLNKDMLVVFAFIWAGVAVYLLDALMQQRLRHSKIKNPV